MPAPDTEPTDAVTSPLRRRYRHARRALGRYRRVVADPQDLAGKLRRQAGRLETQERAIADLKAGLETLRKRLQPVEHAANHREVEHGNLTIQVGVWEERLGRVEQRLADLTDGPLAADDEATREARSLVDEIRREHEQVRVRMQVIAQYEERLRRVEAALRGQHGADRRHPF